MSRSELLLHATLLIQNKIEHNSAILNIRFVLQNDLAFLY